MSYAMYYETWIRQEVERHARYGVIVLPADIMLQIANWIERKRREELPEDIEVYEDHETMEAVVIKVPKTWWEKRHESRP